MHNIHNIFKSQSVRNGIVLLAGTAVYSIGQWLLISYLARNWGIAVLGNYSLALSFVTPFTNLAYYGLRPILAADLKNEFDASALLKLRAIIIFTLSFPFWVGMHLASSNTEILIMTALVFAPKVFEAFSDLCYGELQKRGKSVLHSISVLARSALGIFAFFLASRFFEQYEAGFISLAITWLLVLICYDLPNSELKFKTIFTYPTLAEIALFKAILIKGLPIVFSVCLGAVLLNVPAYFLSHYFGNATLGVYTSLFSFCAIINIFACVLGQTSVPALAKAHHDNNADTFNNLIKTNILLILATAIIASILFSTFGSKILTFAFGSELSDQGDMLAISTIITIPLFIGQYLSFVVNSTANFSVLASSTIASAIVLFFAAPALVSNLGVLGGICTNSIIGVVQIILFTHALNNKPSQ